MLDSWPATDASISGSAPASVNRTATALQGCRAHSRLSHGLKRTTDVVLSLTALIVLAPLLALIAAAIAIDTRGPILFRQKRTGLNGRVFTILKFRSMIASADKDAVHHVRRDDSRITRVGAILRQTSLDELPQLINILKGQMSLVGPRPHALAHDLYYGACLPRYAERFSVLPGLTGLAQVRGLRGGVHDLRCMASRVEADAEYAASRSWLGDLHIITLTIPLLFGRVSEY